MNEVLNYTQGLQDPWLMEEEDIMAVPLVDAVATGENIKRIREEKGLAVKDLQKVFGFDTPQAIYRWQRGETMPCVDNLIVLAKILGVSVEDIVILNDTK